MEEWQSSAMCWVIPFRTTKAGLVQEPETPPWFPTQVGGAQAFKPSSLACQAHQQRFELEANHPEHQSTL